MEQRDRAEARQRGAEVLELIRIRRTVDAADDRHLPVAVADAANDTAERAPVGEIARLTGDAEMLGSGAVSVEVIAIARRSPGQARGKRRRTALEIAARAHHAVRIDHDPGIPHGEVFATNRWQDRLIVDAGVGHQHAERLERPDGARLDVGHGVGLPEALVEVEVEPARIGDGWHTYAPFTCRQGGKTFQPAHALLAQAFGIGHDMRLCDRYEVGRVEEIADFALVAQRPLPRGALLAREQGALFVRQSHVSTRDERKGRSPRPSFATSIRRYARRLDDRGDAGDLALDQLLEGGRAAIRALRRRAAKLDVALFHCRIVERLVQGVRELRNDFWRRPLRRDHRVPGAENEVDPASLVVGTSGRLSSRSAAAIP